MLTDLRQTMAGTGHDLMQPLQIVSHALRRIERVALCEDDRYWLTAAIAQTDRIAEGLSDLIGYSIERPTPPNSEIALNTLLAERADDWVTAAVAGNVRLTVMTTKISVMSNRQRLRSILNNLIGNAIKYSPGGRVIVGARRRAGDILIDVVDNGCGIADPDRERVFTAFCQLRASEGVGLGLSLVREHCAALGYSIELSSVPGRGSRFSVNIGAPCDHGQPS